MVDAKRPMSVLGAGSWGTALAKHLADVGHSVRLWGRRDEQVQALNADGENRQYLPGAVWDRTKLVATSDLEEAVQFGEVIVSVIPSQQTRSVWLTARKYLNNGVPVLCASKGIENTSLELMHDILEETIPEHPIAVLAGPSFAKEVAQHLPTAVVMGARDKNVLEDLQAQFSSDWFRVYASQDVRGLELGGALKNVIAIACGAADGLGFGHNTRAGIITRGLAEISRLAVKLGADPLTLAGLGGMGDLVLTCTGDLSRNRRVGIGLGQGKNLEEVLKEMGQVAEGVTTTLSAKNLADREQVDMPITEQVYRVLYEGQTAKDSVLSLMRRDLKRE